MDEPKVQLVRYGEIGLKLGNRAFFEKKLVDNIRRLIRSLGCTGSVERMRGRIIVRASSGLPLFRVTGIVSYSEAVEVGASFDVIAESLIRMAEQFPGSFRINARRITKTIPEDSMTLNRRLGEIIRVKFKRPVNLSHPDVSFNIEVIKDRAYLFTSSERGVGGLPVGVDKKVAVFLDGREDERAPAEELAALSALLMLKRGCTVELFCHPECSLESASIFMRMVQPFFPEMWGETHEPLKKRLDEITGFRAVVLPSKIKDALKITAANGVPLLFPLAAFDREMIKEELALFRIFK